MIILLVLNLIVLLCIFVIICKKNNIKRFERELEEKITARLKVDIEEKIEKKAEEKVEEKVEEKAEKIEEKILGTLAKEENIERIQTIETENVCAKTNENTNNTVKNSDITLEEQDTKDCHVEKERVIENEYQSNEEEFEQGFEEELEEENVFLGKNVGLDFLDYEQYEVYNRINLTNENFFVTGKAGTGKSYLLNVFDRNTNKSTIKLAPTGIAALNIGGATLHSTFGYKNLIETDIKELNKFTLNLKSEKIVVLKKVDTIIIDEISMVRADVFDKIDKILRIINNTDKPFGGKQMILFGDVFQLPPIADKNEEKYLRIYYNGIHFFNSKAYQEGNFGFAELSINHRQEGDKKFFDILNRMREGCITDEDIVTLNTRCMQKEVKNVLSLFPKKADAEQKNRDELDKICSKEYIYECSVILNGTNNKNPNLESIFPISEELHLKVGAMVMMVSNDTSHRWVNGTIGFISRLYNNIIFVIIDGIEYEVYKAEFVERKAVYEHGKITYEEILRVQQFPVVLAYAITIHKSQGMTYNEVICDISTTFAPGQSYVALSRCSKLSGLHMLKRINRTMIKVDSQVAGFYSIQKQKNILDMKPIKK